MDQILLHPTYFPSVVQMVAAAQAKEVVFEVHDNYQKQTYRNRACIAHSNGRLLLNVPVKHSVDGTRQRTRDVLVENNFPWQEQHWKSLQSAYRTSPFFEFYEDELEPLFTEPVEGLLKHNLEVFEILSGLIGIEAGISETESYIINPEYPDLRFLAEAKGEPVYSLRPYIQTFETKHGFLSNLSVLDLLFQEGPNTLLYLQRQQLEFPA